MDDRSMRQWKRRIVWIGAAVCLLLGAVYLHALFRPGLWMRDTFLYCQEDGSFAGSDKDADYKMQILRQDKAAQIEFSVNETKKLYEVRWDTDSSRGEILENGTPVFEGEVHLVGDTWLLTGDGEDIYFDMQIKNGEYTERSDEELFPDYSRIYRWAVNESCQRRGRAEMLPVIALLGILLALDMAFPDLFFKFQHGLAVEGGEPSELYRMGQFVGRIAMVLGIILGVAASFHSP